MGMTSSEDLSIHVRAIDNGPQVFELAGTLDIATSPTVRGALLEASERGIHKMIVDLSGLEFIDSTGLGALIGGQRRGEGEGRQHRPRRARRPDLAPLPHHRTAADLRVLSFARRGVAWSAARRRLVVRVRLVKQGDDVLHRRRVPGGAQAVAYLQRAARIRRRDDVRCDLGDALDLAPA